MRRPSPLAGALAAAAAAVSLTVSACGGGSSAAEGTASSTSAASVPQESFTVSSTLDGLRVLPHRIRWIARPSLPEAQVGRVDFLVDGKVAWNEEEAPYYFSEDDGPHRGYLVTSWLRPGVHVFAVRATAADGRTATERVRARVVPSPALPAELAGRWTRTISDTGAAPAPGGPGNPTETHTPPGTYTIELDARFWRTRFPGRFVRPQSDDTGHGWILDSDYVAGAGTLRAQGQVAFHDFDATTAEGGSWCYTDGPAATYRWSVSGDALTLTPAGGADPCGIRGFVWAGTWTRPGR